MDYKIKCFPETRLMDSVLTYNMFVSNYKLFRADRVYDNATLRGGGIIAISLMFV
jgi:hypothetical protein